jgi:hypothetical protein
MSRLPTIQGATSYGEEKGPSIFEVQQQGIPEDNNVQSDNQFEIEHQKLSSMTFPALNPELSMKNRISNLEMTTELQTEFDRLAGSSLRGLSNNVHNLEEMLRMLVKETQSDFEVKIAAMRKEYDHR